MDNGRGIAQIRRDFIKKEIDLANSFAEKAVEDIFPKLWQDKKEELKSMSKKELAEIKKTLNGNIHIEMHSGNINRFHILSKIFSLLNVYQIFKFKLPDLVTEGMPYNSIIANFEIKNGIAETEDLLIDSDSMRITTVGEIDILLSLRITSMLVLSAPRLFRPSKASPAVREPSPTIATTL